MLVLICTVLTTVVMVLGFGVAALCILIGIIGFIYELCDLIDHVLTHIERWNKWRKKCSNGWFHKFLVLIGLQVSPTMILTLTDEEVDDIVRGLDEINVVAKESAINLITEVKEDDKQDL